MDKVSNAATDVISKILDETKKRKQEEEEKQRQMNESLSKYKDDINQSLDNNLEQEDKEIKEETNEKVSEQTDNEHNQTDHERMKDNKLNKNDIDPMLQDEFKKIEALVNQKSLDDVNVNDFKNKLQSLAKDFDKKTSPKRSPIKAVKRSMGKVKYGTKSYAQDKINKFMNKMNSKVKEMSNQIDKKFNSNQSPSKKTKEHQKSLHTEKMTYKDKIEQTLKNDPDLFKAAVTATQIKSMENHLEESKKRLNQLENIIKDDPVEQYKIDDMKSQLSNHINGMDKELNNLEQSHDPEKTMQKVNEQSMEQEQDSQLKEEKDKEDKDIEKSKPKYEEHVMER